MDVASLCSFSSPDRPHSLTTTNSNPPATTATAATTLLSKKSSLVASAPRSQPAPPTVHPEAMQRLTFTDTRPPFESENSGQRAVPPEFRPGRTRFSGPRERLDDEYPPPFYPGNAPSAPSPRSIGHYSQYSATGPPHTPISNVYPPGREPTMHLYQEYLPPQTHASWQKPTYYPDTGHVPPRFQQLWPHEFYQQPRFYTENAAPGAENRVYYPYAENHYGTAMYRDYFDPLISVPTARELSPYLDHGVTSSQRKTHPSPLDAPSASYASNDITNLRNPTPLSPTISTSTNSERSKQKSSRTVDQDLVAVTNLNNNRPSYPHDKQISSRVDDFTMQTTSEYMKIYENSILLCQYAANNLNTIRSNGIVSDNSLTGVQSVVQRTAQHPSAQAFDPMLKRAEEIITALHTSKNLLAAADGFGDDFRAGRSAFEVTNSIGVRDSELSLQTPSDSSSSLNTALPLSAGDGERNTKQQMFTNVADRDLYHQKYKKRNKQNRPPPPGRCQSCNTSDTPEWRRGPDGARTLCNACGLHFSKLCRRKVLAQKQKSELQRFESHPAPITPALPDASTSDTQPISAIEREPSNPFVDDASVVT